MRVPVMNSNFVSKQPAECRFCGYLAGRHSTHEADYPWVQNDDYAALVSVGALVPGWSLVCPVTHAFNLSRDFSSPAFWKFTDSVVDTCTSLHGPIRVFEHGACAAESLTSCGTAHAHLHIVPLDFSLVNEAVAFDPTRTWQNCRVTEIARFASGGEYLYMADSYDGEATEGYISLLQTGTSQFFRRVIANKLGCADKFDYRAHPNHDMADSSAVELRQVVASRGRNAA